MLGDVEGDIGRERRLSHAGPSRQDDEVRGLHPAHDAVEVVEPRGEAREVAVALEGRGRHVDGVLERVGEAGEAALVAAGFRQLVEAALGILDLIGGRHVDRRVVGDVDDILADQDQRAANGEVVDGLAIVGGIDDGRRLGGESGEVLRDRQPADVLVGARGKSSASPASRPCRRGSGSRWFRRSCDAADRRSAREGESPRRGRRPRC